MITRAITASRINDNNTDEIRSIPSTITEKFIAQKPNQITSTSCQPQTTSVTLNPDLNNAEVTIISILTNSALIPGITMPLQVPSKVIRSNSEICMEPNTSE